MSNKMSYQGGGGGVGGPKEYEYNIPSQNNPGGQQNSQG